MICHGLHQRGTGVPQLLVRFVLNKSKAYNAAAAVPRSSTFQGVSMRIGVTGASGQLGMAVVRHLLARTSAADIVAITRSPEKLAAFSSQGVNVRAGDFKDQAGLEKAFSGIQRL